MNKENEITTSSTSTSDASSSTTSTEIRSLFFNVGDPFEVTEEDFNNDLWPLKHQNSSTRQEDIPNDKQRKTNIRPTGLCEVKIKITWSVFSNMVQIERLNNSPDHTHMLEDSDMLKRSDAIRALVTNEAIMNYKPVEITSAIKEYAKNEFGLDDILCRTLSRFSTSEREKVKRTEGIVFMHLRQLEKLQRHDSATIAKALKLIREKCRWVPHYILIDQSSTEANSIMQAFPGINASEQECKILFYSVHLMRTWVSKIYEDKTRSIMIAAIHKKTKIGCEQLVQEAISTCLIPAVSKYIQRNYMKNTHQWAFWARNYSPLLLQVTSTNALESFHSELKRTTSHLHGLISAAHKVIDLNQKKQIDAKAVPFNFRTKKVSVYGIEDEIIKEIYKFLYPMQLILVKEACAVMDRLAKGKGAPGLTSLDCYCLFHNQYLLPCKHIFHEHTYGSNRLLTTKAWRMFQEIFEESGFEVYEHYELVIMEKLGQSEEEKKAENRRLTVNKLTERLHDRYWSVEEGSGAEEAEAFVSRLEGFLSPILGLN
ncbi:1023_t:CDS:2 [Scutellospora calospora]|uniref:1023_t:CDS:1 n=1 Tax=Scutellospora calospora TaxID=85575 RepID=A0ACA9JVA9_9GLOM|nr:1023_t:CDS:2 [Scutellospora calospora]